MNSIISLHLHLLISHVKTVFSLVMTTSFLWRGHILYLYPFKYIDVIKKLYKLLFYMLIDN